ncbi:cobalamin biosynthesis protein CobT [Leucobacter exalbidus]|uniref:Cobalamin biosynthesis protein CobT n=1 Tax=Leucobacter exalbidus TaxID=662960 RepID=A0A940T1Q9_9MICO|nr:DUF3027 domain-containing protein [Leucobacter exalbidus]MBP1327105.1 cobalamin biosynthesis protein CobT [Leucobacter exalbidus]
MLDHDMRDGQDVTAEVIVPDQELLAARAQARHALEEITEVHSIGAEAGYEVHEERVVTLFFDCRMAGYPGWRWAATVAKVDADAPVNVLEVEMLAGEGSVVAPDWVPWSERLAQFRETQSQHATDGSDDDEDDTDETAAARAAAAELSDEDDAEDNLLDNDFSDFDDEIDLDSDDDDSDDDDDDDDDDDSDDDDESDDDGDESDDDESDDDDDFDDESDDEDSDDEDSDDEDEDAAPAVEYQPRNRSRSQPRSHSRSRRR